MRSTIGDTADGETRRGTGLRDPRYVGGDRTREATGRNRTDVVLGVLERIMPLDAHILEAQRAGDVELADFLREVRSEDLVRSRLATGLLRRTRGDD
jgi:hypothetical protein